MDIASSAVARRKLDLMLLDGSQLVAKALSQGIKLNAVYCRCPHDLGAQLSNDIISSRTKLYQLTSQQTKLARNKGILSSLFGTVAAFHYSGSDCTSFSLIAILCNCMQCVINH